MKHIPADFLSDFKRYVSYQSISTDPTYLPEIDKTVAWLTLYLEGGGAKVRVLKKGQTNPVVVGHFAVGADVPTVLVYGHYDVQPAAKQDGWTTRDPFLLEERRGKYVARGVVDNKGQNLIHLYTVRKLFKAGKLRYNVKFLLEGNEESGNPDLPALLRQNKKLLASDYIVVSDGEIAGRTPVLESSLRGASNLRVVLKTGTNNLHSGIYGGAVPSAPQELAFILASLKDRKGKVLIPGFYRGVRFPSKALQRNNRRLGSDLQAMKLAGVKKLITLRNLDFYSATGLLPTLEISGIKSGYIGEGYSNIVPGTAEARINMRTVPPQSTDKTLRLVCEYIRKAAPPYAEVSIESVGHDDPVQLDSDAPAARDIARILKRVYGKSPLQKFVGGSIPILGDFRKLLKTRVISVSLGNDDCHMHGTDENYTVDLVRKGLAFSEAFFGGQ